MFVEWYIDLALDVEPHNQHQMFRNEYCARTDKVNRLHFSECYEEKAMLIS